MNCDLRLGDAWYSAALLGRPGGGQIEIEGCRSQARLRCLDEREGLYELDLDGKNYPLNLALQGDRVFVQMGVDSFEIEVLDPLQRLRAAAGDDRDSAAAPMPGTLVELLVQVGQQVTEGEPLLVIESMKLQTLIKAWRDGQVAELPFAPGSNFDKGAHLVRLATEDDSEPGQGK